MYKHFIYAIIFTAAIVVYQINSSNTDSRLSSINSTIENLNDDKLEDELKEVEKGIEKIVALMENPEVIELENNQIVDNLCINQESIRLNWGEILFAKRTWQGVEIVTLNN